MAEVKVEEGQYYSFLNSVKNYIDKTKKYDLEKQEKDDAAWIYEYIEKELKIRGLMLERKSWYDFYVQTKESNIEVANEAYQKYIYAKVELEKLKAGENKNAK